LCQDSINPGDGAEVYHDEALRSAVNIAKLPGHCDFLQEFNVRFGSKGDI